MLISSFWGGNPRKIIDFWQSHQVVLLISKSIIDEYRKVICRFDPDIEVLDNFSKLITLPSKTIFINPKIRTDAIKDDPNDNIFLDCALEGNADVIISGDKNLLKLGKFHDCLIITPNEFLIKLH